MMEATPTSVPERSTAPLSPGVEDALFDTPVFGIVVLTGDGRVARVNETLARALGRDIIDLIGAPFTDLVEPDAVPEARDALRGLTAGSRPATRAEVRFRRPDGSIGWAALTGRQFEDAAGRPRILVTAEDITERKRREARQEGERAVLEQIAKGAPLVPTLEAIAALIEGQSAEMFASILLVDDGGHVHVAAGRSFPAVYNEAIEGQPIGPRAGSCGTAAWRRETVVTPDIATDPLWSDYREVALAAGLASSWSTPLFASDGRVVGTLAQYYQRAQDPTPKDLQLISIARHLAEIAIDRARVHEELEKRVADRTAALAVSEARLRAIVDHTSDAVFVKDLDDRFLLVNDAAAAAMGRARDQMLGLTTADVLDAESARCVRELDQRVSRSGAATTLEERVTVRGEERVFHSTKFPYWSDDGAVMGVVGISRDITDRIRSEEQLRRSERLLSEAQSLAHMGSWEWDAQANEVRWSDELYRIYGLRPQEFGATFEAFLAQIHPDDQQRVRSTVEGALATGEPWSIEERVVRPSGEVVVLASSGRVDRDAAGRAVRLWGICLDITDRKRAEQAVMELNASLERRVADRTLQLEAANRELEAFSYSVSHDLRAPLRAIDGFSQALLEDYDRLLDDTGRDFLRRVRAASQHMSDLIDDMLKLSRLTRGEMVWRRIDLTALARRVADEHLATVPDRRIDLRIAPDLVAWGDERLLRGVLDNLLGNAVKFTGRHEAARIEVGEADAGGERAFFVQDDGAGFDMAHAENLFKPFFRLHGQHEFEGNGVGLATVQRIVHRHGGRIWAESAPERGATFWFTLPREPR